MFIVKHSKDSNLQRWQKKRFLSLNNLLFALLPCILLGTLMGTYLDLYFVGKGFYSFPKRLFPEIFTIHIGFTLIAMPIFTAVCLLLCYRMTLWHKGCFLILLSLFMSWMEKQAEAFGFFIHEPTWKHIYSFIGYQIYFLVLYPLFHTLMIKIAKK